MDSKIRIKLGTIEVEYEGDSEFLKKDLLGLVKDIVGVYKENVELIEVQSEGGESKKQDHKISSLGTTNSIASKLSVESGPELVIAACAYLQFSLNKEKYSRQDILDAMKMASSYYKTTYSGNLTASITRLIKKGDILEKSSGMYALSAGQVSSLENQLA